MSAVLFIAGLVTFAAGSGVLLGGGSLCANAAATSFAHAMGAPCGGLSRGAGLLLLGVAATILWGSTRLQHARGTR